MNLNSKKSNNYWWEKGWEKVFDNQKLAKFKVVACSRKEIEPSITSVEKFLKKNNFADIVVLNSGGPPPMKFNDIKINDWKKYFNQLFLSYFLILKNLKIKKNGYIFYISSSIIKEPGNSLIISSSLRSAMSSLLKSYSLNNLKRGITVINIAPGPSTQRVKELVSNLKKFEKQLPTGKIGDPNEIGKFVRFVVENKIKYISGSTVYFDGNINKSFL